MCTYALCLCVCVCVCVCVCERLYVFERIQHVCLWLCTLCSSRGVGERISCSSSLILRDSQVLSDMRREALLLGSGCSIGGRLRGLCPAWERGSGAGRPPYTPRVIPLPVIMEAWRRQCHTCETDILTHTHTNRQIGRAHV